MHKTIGFTLAALMVATLGGCSQSVVEGGAPEVAPAAPSTEAIADRFNGFANALYTGDEAALRASLSDELLKAAEAMGVETFLSVHKDLMIQTLGAMDAGPQGGFTVVSAEAEGDAVRTTLAFHGKTLEKEIFFVKSGDDYKLNFMRPGFTHATPEDAALGYDNYTVQNSTDYGAQMSCSSDNGMKAFASAPHSTIKVSCRNTCHWYRWGSWFQYGSYRLQCTWNSFGSDVNVNGGGFSCKSVCF